MAPLACPVAAGLLASAVAGAAALDETGLEAAGLGVVELEPLEHAATTKPIPIAPMTLAVWFLMMKLPLRHPTGSARGHSTASQAKA